MNPEGSDPMTQAPSTATRPPSRLARIQDPVQDRLDQVVEEIRRIILNDLGLLADVNDVLLRMRGKLFRPTLLLLVNEVGGERHEDAPALAAVVELVHLATLVHDDAVDHSVLRRGLPTINHLWNHQVAIISGDYLYTRTVVELSRIGNLEAIRSLGRAANDMTVGELRQLTSHDALDFTEADYTRLIAAKTASLMAAACELGALVGPSEAREAFRRYGHALGMAFQVADDLLDYEGSEALTGKPVGHDLRERKVTLPLVFALRNVSEAAGERIRSFFTRVDPTDAEIEEIIEIVREAGGLEYARTEARRYADEAREALASVGRSGRAMESLEAAIEYAIERRR
jgi:octaprenyl-diphosphate synthase